MSVAVHASDVLDDARRFRRRDERVLAYALGASVLLHAVAMALAPGLRSREPLALPPLEVAIVTAPRPLPVKAEPPPRPRLPPPPTPPKPRPQLRPQPQPLAAPSTPAPPAAAPERPPVLALPQPQPSVPAFTVPQSAGDSRSAAADAKSSLPAPAPAPAAPSPAPAAARDTASPVTPPVFNAAYLGNAPPRYPLIARRNGVEGTVQLRVLVTRDGRPAHVDIEKSSGSSALDHAALEAVKGWKFAPARRGQEPVEQAVVVPIVFRLEGTS